MNRCTCMFMQTRRMAAPCGRTCAAKSKRESARQWSRPPGANPQPQAAERAPSAHRRSSASWSLGMFNGLLRQYVPKKRQLESITNEEIKMIENRLNNRPRKRLVYRTPAEVFHQSLSRVALRA